MYGRQVANLFIWLVSGVILTVASILLLRGAVAVGEPLILPHMFNVATGNSAVVLQNLSADQQDLNVEFFAQDGSFFDLVAVTVPGLGAAQVPTPGGGAGFIGSVQIFGEAAFTARGQWNFNISGNPVAVGVPSLLKSQSSSTFHMPIGSVGTNSMVGVAIENPEGATIDCGVTYRNPDGDTVSEEQHSVPGFGQISQFATSVSAGFEGAGTVQCSGPAAVVAVIQEQVNGFPTTLFAAPGS